MLARELRQKYLDFFEARGHRRLPGSSLIPVDALGAPDTTTLFTSAGMQQFKPFFTGAAVPPAPRIVTVQKCLRTVDIDTVGDFSHCTFFEMLGNFSFGDYFKSEVIPWTWQFLTETLGLDEARLCVTVFEEDDDAAAIWRSAGVPEARIHRLGESKNYWPAGAITNGPNGPCGPCTEIFYRIAPPEAMCDSAELTPTERYLVDEEAGRWIEIWNNVFTQFDRTEADDGTPALVPLPARNNDTGAGLDRIATIIQGKSSVFDTDLFRPILARLEEMTGEQYAGTVAPRDFAFRVVAEHARSMVMCIGDGILPANEGRGYVLRYIMRRAIRYARTALGLTEPFLAAVAPIVIEQMGDFYPELRERQSLILKTVDEEEDRFTRTLAGGLARFHMIVKQTTSEGRSAISGADAFLLYGTYGFPVQLTTELASEAGLTVSHDEFEAALREEAARSRSHADQAVFSAGGPAAGSPGAITAFVGYDSLSASARVLAIFSATGEVDSARPGDVVRVTLDQSPFYAEAGGQVGDTGRLAAPANGVQCALNAEVLDTTKASGSIVLRVKILEGELAVGQTVTAVVSADRRAAIRRNHTATHMLQAALRTHLGDHVYQKGSLVGPDRLRFDFTHGQPIPGGQLQEIERTVNAAALRDLPVQIHTDVPIAEARERGAMALFGEKYGEVVRMVEIPELSLELCGGTHIEHTAQIGLFKIVSETGVGSGVRRIEALTGEQAYALVTDREQTINRLAALLKSSPAAVLEAAERLAASRAELEREVRALKAKVSDTGDVEVQELAGAKLIVRRLQDVDNDTAALMADTIAQSYPDCVIVLAAVNGDRLGFTIKASPTTAARGIHAGNLVRAVAKAAGGGGGGRADFAQAGARNPELLESALALLPGLISEQTAASLPGA